MSLAPQMKKEWQIIDFNNYEEKLRNLVAYGDSIDTKIKVYNLELQKYRMREKHKLDISAI